MLAYVERVLNRLSVREQRRERADKAIARAGGVDGLNGAAGNGQRLALD